MTTSEPSPAKTRLRPLPSIPNLEPSGPTAGPLSSSTDVEEDRHSILTFNSIGTTLPRYSTLELLGPDTPLEQIDHWPEDDVRSIASSSSIPAARPPGYTSQPNLPHRIVIPPPISGARPRSVLHQFHLGGGGNRFGLGKGKSSQESWATLKLLSRAAPGSKTRLPRFIGGDVLRGWLDLRLDEPMNIHSIKLALTGTIQVGEGFKVTPYLSAGEHVFLDQTHCVYSKNASSDPRWNGRCITSMNKEFDGSLHGSYSFPFSLPFPTYVHLKPENPVKSQGSGNNFTRPMLPYDPPPSFREKNRSSAAIYELGLVITHGAFRSKSRKSTEIILVPKKVCPPASEGRQSAYREGALLPGPVTDPDGWHASDSVAIQGRYRDYPVQASCTLYLANPLAYTRGTVIPCYIIFECPDFAFLEEITTPHTINLYLSRHIQHMPGQEIKPGEEQIRPEAGHAARLAKATWWKPPKTDTPLVLAERYLEGEVHLPKNMISSCDYPLFHVEYALELFPFSFNSFKPEFEAKMQTVRTGKDADNKFNEERLLLRQVVDIATFHEHGPVPVAFTTPMATSASDSRASMGGKNLAYTPVQGLGYGFYGN